MGEIAVINPSSIKRELSDIQRRLRCLQAQIDRAHEGIALKFHREEVINETADEDAGGELDARCEAGPREGDPPSA
ncbi:MAG: hypothetical protein E6G10_19205 [Actinobacteria bacterium]|nr:MAG: hypothetical protein E6G10_19205 [Actinomycetota bacterium]